MRGAFLLLGLALSCGGDPAPDLVLYGGGVITIDEALPEAEAFLVREGRIAAVGSDHQMLQLAGKTAQKVDLRGKTVVPGFNDAHLHTLLLPPGSASLAGTTRVDEVVAVLTERARAAPDAHWVVGYDYDAALEAAGVGPETPDPDEGFFFRDDQGRPTGLISERPALEALVTEEQPTPLVNDLDSALAGLEVFYRQALSLGITSMTDALVPPELALAYWLSSPDRAGVRVNLMLDAEKLQAAKWMLRLNDVVAWFGWHPLDNPWLRARTVKLYHGLSLSGRTARLYEAYADRPGYFGLEPQRPQAELNELVAEIHEAGFQVGVHANGDYEIDMVLDAIEQAVGDGDRQHRHRIEHGSVVNAKILSRMRDLGVVYAPHSYVYEKGPMLEAYGEQRWAWMFANASSFEHGIPNAANSDFPVSDLNPMLRIQSLVTRRSRWGTVYGPSQRLSVEQALHAYTMGSAYASFEEDEKGSITPGKLADFVILSHDPRAVLPESISTIVVEQTFVAGVKRFDRSEADD
jgi:predicted amidohydrolase YtcJ